MTQQGKIHRRDEIMRYISDYAKRLGGPTPSIREVALHFGISYAAAHGHIMTLIIQGRLAQKDGKLCIPGSRWEGPPMPKIVLPDVGTVYIVRFRDVFKIGLTHCGMRQRLQGLPKGCEVVKAVDCYLPGAVERRLHVRYDDVRVRGEWFELTPQAVAEASAILEQAETFREENPGIHYADALSYWVWGEHGETETHQGD